MKYFRPLRLLLAVFLSLSVLVASGTAFAAYNPFGQTDCSRASNSTICSTPTGQDPVTGPNGVVLKSIRIIAGVAAVAAIFIIMIAGITYITSEGEADKVSRAKRTIIYASVGLIIIALSQAIIGLVIGGI